WAGRRPAPTFMKDRTNIRAGGTQSRHHPHKQARRQNRSEGEKVDPRVRPEIESQRQVRAERKRAQESRSPRREHQSCATAQKRKQETFRQILPDQATLACTQGRLVRQYLTESLLLALLGGGD